MCSMLVILCPFGGANASCAAPSLFVGEDDVPVLRSGSTVRVQGSHFVDGGCDDQGGGSLGCSAPDEEEPTVPMTDVGLVIRQDGQEWELGTASAGTAADNRLGQIAWEVTLPRQLRGGDAVLVTEAGRLEIVVKR